MKTHLSLITTAITFLLLNFSLYAQNGDITSLINKANAGNANAQNELAVCYVRGKGVNQSYTEAVNWFRKAAEQGLAEAQYSLWYCYYSGIGVNQDYVEAMKWLRKAAKQGNAEAQNSLGYYYEIDELNPKKAVALRLDAEVVDAFRAQGRGWQTNINQILRGWLANQPPA